MCLLYLLGGFDAPFCYLVYSLLLWDKKGLDLDTRLFPVVEGSVADGSNETIEVESGWFNLHDSIVCFGFVIRLLPLITMIMVYGYLR